MKKSRKLKTPLKVVIINPPSKEEAKNIIKEISIKISEIYSLNVTNELEEARWKRKRKKD